MRDIRFNAPLPWTPKPLYQWFVQAISGLRFTNRYGFSYCCDPPGVINLAVDMTGSEYIDAFPTLLEGMVHEARHADGTRHTCGNLDNTIAELGASGVQYYVMLWLGEHSVGGLMSTDERAYCVNRAQNVRYYSFCHECGR